MRVRWSADGTPMSCVNLGDPRMLLVGTGRRLGAPVAESAAAGCRSTRAAERQARAGLHTPMGRPVRRHGRAGFRRNFGHQRQSPGARREHHPAERGRPPDTDARQTQSKGAFRLPTGLEIERFEQARPSFLKKRSKKLLRPLSRFCPASARQRRQSFLVLFFKKGLLAFCEKASRPAGVTIRSHEVGKRSSSIPSQSRSPHLGYLRRRSTYGSSQLKGGRGVSSFIVVATGSRFSGPEERTASTAVHAEAHHLCLTRLCGRSGKVQVFVKLGREISWQTLQRMAVAERNG